MIDIEQEMELMPRIEKTMSKSVQAMPSDSPRENRSLEYVTFENRPMTRVHSNSLDKVRVNMYNFQDKRDCSRLERTSVSCKESMDTSHASSSLCFL